MSFWLELVGAALVGVAVGVLIGTAVIRYLK